MGFIGSINDKLRKFFATHAGILNGRDCYIGCSGNFTIEQIITRQCPNARLHSNDISLYSSALGHYLTSKPFRMKIVNSELLWANEYLDRGPVVGVATLLLLLEMLKFEKRSNAFSERQWLAYQTSFDRLLSRTVSKILDASQHIRVADYTEVDVFDYYPRPDGVSIGFLPTYVGGYEKLFAKLDKSVDWDRPTYGMLTTERREQTIQKMLEGDYILYDDRERDLPCTARVDLFGKRTVYIYSNLAFLRGIFRKKINERIPRFALLMPDEEIHDNSALSLRSVDLATINHYRNLFLSKKIQPGNGDTCFIAFAGEKAFGFIIFQAYSKRGSAPGEIYLLSDFVVPSSRYRRLAKLLLLVIKTSDMRCAVDERHLRHYNSTLTTAFTDKPVSMKYRGIFDLVKRGEGFLNYRCTFDDTTLTEVIPLWKKKYEKV